MDRRFADQLQNELYAEDDDEEEKEESWWDSMTFVFTSSVSANHVTTEKQWNGAKYYLSKLAWRAKMSLPEG
jgi:hypothetical protein